MALQGLGAGGIGRSVDGIDAMTLADSEVQFRLNLKLTRVYLEDSEVPVIEVQVVRRSGPERTVTVGVIASVLLLQFSGASALGVLVVLVADSAGSLSSTS